MIVGRRRDRDVVSAGDMRGDVDDSRLRARRVAPIGSHRRRLADQAQFYASRTIRRRRFRSATGGTKDDEDDPVDVQAPSAPIQDDVQVVVEANVPHRTDEPHPFAIEAILTT